VSFRDLCVGPVPHALDDVGLKVLIAVQLFGDPSSVELGLEVERPRRNGGPGLADGSVEQTLKVFSLNRVC
jgi:hypothetical protein